MDKTTNNIVIPKNYAYDCENADYLYYRDLYTGKEIKVPKTKDIIIVIPENATNGDMIMAMFPNAKIWKVKEPVSGYCRVCVAFKDLLEIKTFDLDWWNAPYKGVEE